MSVDPQHLQRGQQGNAFGSLPAALWRTTRRACTAKVLFGWPPEKPSRETAWLDGLRGVAAFLVVIYHFGLKFHNPLIFDTSYGAQNLVGFAATPRPVDEEPRVFLYEIWRLPFLRFFMVSGHTQVSIFFVLSGFVLSWGPLTALRKGDMDKFSRSLSSSVFRRWIRLYLPCFAVAFLKCLMVSLGLHSDSGVERVGFFAQVWDYLKADARFANPFLINRVQLLDIVHKYDWTMWTIPLEFAGSLLVFLLLLAISRFRSYRKRTVILLVSAVYAMAKAEWNFWLFATGVLLCDYVVNAGGFKKLRGSQISYTCWSIALIVGLFLGAAPANSKFYTTPGYDWLLAMTPGDKWREVEGGGRFWWCWAGILIVFSAVHLPKVQRLFELPPMIYMGRVSYMLYLTHRIVFDLLGEPLGKMLYKLFGRELFLDDSPSDNDFTHALGTIAIYIVLLITLIPPVIMFGHWCEVLIDAPSTKFARRVDEWFLKNSDAELDHEKEMIPLRSLATGENEFRDTDEEHNILGTRSNHRVESVPLPDRDRHLEVGRSNV
jgi:peptidoglycan/LPS O-acetylase OafA/YrhL